MARIVIVGAGIAGLALARCLRAREVPVRILEAQSGRMRHDYGITLSASAYRPLLQVIGTDLTTFRKQVALQAFPVKEDDWKSNDSDDDIRCHAGRLEQWLAKRLVIDMGHKVTSISECTTTYPLRLGIQGAVDVEADLVLAADGVHSSIQRIFGTKMLDVLPYVVINIRHTLKSGSLSDGQRSKLKAAAASAFQRCGVVVLHTEVYQSHENPDSIIVNYTYSRPAKKNTLDTLYRPDRTIDGAVVKDVETVQTLRSELSAFTNDTLLFEILSDENCCENTRILSWLMRYTRMDRDFLKRMSDKNIVFVGDAAHSMPIITSQGANLALQDAVILSEHISKFGITGIANLFDQRAEQWQAAIDDSRSRLHQMHTIES